MEGDAIITDLEYKIKDETYLIGNEEVNKTTYIMTVDSTRDEFASKEDRKIKVNEDIPGDVYGITKIEKDNLEIVSLELYAEIMYVTGQEPYESIEVCTYSKDIEVI